MFSFFISSFIFTVSFCLLQSIGLNSSFLLFLYIHLSMSFSNYLFISICLPYCLSHSSSQSVCLPFQFINLLCFFFLFRHSCALSSISSFFSLFSLLLWCFNFFDLFFLNRSIYPPVYSIYFITLYISLPTSHPLPIYNTLSTPPSINILQPCNLSYSPASPLLTPTHNTYLSFLIPLYLSVSPHHPLLPILRTFTPHQGLQGTLKGNWGGEARWVSGLPCHYKDHQAWSEGQWLNKEMRDTPALIREYWGCLPVWKVRWGWCGCVGV